MPPSTSRLRRIDFKTRGFKFVASNSKGRNPASPGPAGSDAHRVVARPLADDEPRLGLAVGLRNRRLIGPQGLTTIT